MDIWYTINENSKHVVWPYTLVTKNMKLTVEQPCQSHKSPVCYSRAANGWEDLDSPLIDDESDEIYQLYSPLFTP